MEQPMLRRDIQLVPTTYQGRRVIVCIDPLKLAEGDIALDAGMYRILAMLDGRHGLRDLQAAIGGMGGTTVSLEEVESLLLRLDEYYILDSERFRCKKRHLVDAFLSEPDRHPAFAGKAYSAGADELGAHIADLERRLPPLDEPQNSPGAHGEITGLMAPHIDTGIAGGVYVDLYRRIKNKRYDRVIVLGINHQEQDCLYSISGKNFITPFGSIPPDTDFITALTEDLPPGVTASDDFGHKIEHSIEFQTIYLRHYLGPAFSLVPVLCGSIHSFIAERRPLLEDRRFLALYERMNRLLNSDEKSTLIVAAVDLSHVGLKFGHLEAGSVMLKSALEKDKELLSFIARGDAEGIYRHACNSEDYFNVCGLPAIILFTLLMRNHRGRVLAHETYREEATQSAVTYAAMVFETNPEAQRRVEGKKAAERADS